MNHGKKRVKDITDLFRKRLVHAYPENEILNFLDILFHHFLGWSRVRILLNRETVLPEKVVAELSDALEELTAHRPIQYITGTAWFLGTKLGIRPGVLIPRPETEELVKWILEEHPPDRERECTILDIGTGSGCISISLKKNFPDARVCATDCSRTALDLAGKNAKANGVHIEWFFSDILSKKDWDALPLADWIVSNPPYVTGSDKKQMHPNILLYEPEEALFVPDNDPMRYNSAIAEFAASHLIRPGRLYLEINERFGNATCDLLSRHGFRKIRLRKDMYGKDRFVAAEPGRDSAEIAQVNGPE